MENTLNDIINGSIQDLINKAYQRRMKSMTRYEREVFDGVVETFPEKYTTKISLIDLVKEIKRMKITKKKLEQSRKAIIPIEADGDLPF